MRPDVTAAIRARIRDIPDFPTPGILFKDITPVLADPALLALAVESMASPWRGQRITHVAAPESRGFLFGAPIAVALGAGFVPVRKRGKLPWRTRQEVYALEYGTDVIEVHEDAVGPGTRVLLVDDVLATGGTASAACRLLEALGAQVAGVSMLMSLDFLPGREALAGRRIEALVRYA